MSGPTFINVQEGLGAETLAATIILGVFSSLTCILRVWARISKTAMGLDDYLMVLGTLSFIACCVIAGLGCLSGFGAKDDVVLGIDPTGQLRKNGFKWVFFFGLAYMACLPPIKISICITLLRVTTAKRYTIPLWLVIIVSVVGTGSGIATIMIQCKPIAANWDESVGKCGGWDRVGTMTTAMSAVSIITDWMCAIIPALLLWDLNMKPQVKASLIFVLALGALASIATCVRLPYIRMYTHAENQPTDGLYKGCRIIIWSIVECGVGIIGGCLPPLRPLLVRFGLGFGSTTGKQTYEPPANSHSILSGSNKMQALPAAPEAIQLGSMRRAGRGNSVVTTCQGGTQSRSEWWDNTSESDDSSSQKFIIMKNTRIDVKYGDV
ncbi:hypothetical protein K445DRAFT_369073 [Daldinia sp. EC12]|nr:hypothetical protein K445DRAFT_369073 [Daldinia sp. EC12]